MRTPCTLMSQTGPALREFSPGSLLMWKNTTDVRELCEYRKKLHFL
ncbi:hypothetical protein ACT0ZX_000270 [Yersinia enterocolitica]|nr:hypothetical protein [Yersinia enterocolitica]